jgi:hypothetical protein
MVQPCPPRALRWAPTSSPKTAVGAGCMDKCALGCDLQLLGAILPPAAQSHTCGSAAVPPLSLLAGSLLLVMPLGSPHSASSAPTCSSHGSGCYSSKPSTSTTSQQHRRMQTMSPHTPHQPPQQQLTRTCAAGS